jgi:multisite-specific tRNA:(cytosine-C5)-methyltransferase
VRRTRIEGPLLIVVLSIPFPRVTRSVQTSQLLESLHSSESLLESCVPPGLLVANDSDSKRTQLLIHQTARLPSPAFVVTNVDGSIFPTLFLPREDTTDSSGRKTRPSPLLFDRILCDVPCSGDGTIRKNVGIWKKWSPMDGNGLACVCVLTLAHAFGAHSHSFSRLQLRILQRAMRMLRPGRQDRLLDLLIESSRKRGCGRGGAQDHSW